jgi:putative heme-binding domain-containing protein
MLSGVGSFTSACSINVYLGGALPPALGLFALVAEPAQNLVHRDVLTPHGATYLAKRAHDGVEFLASTDPWFRPVNFYIGPEGAIYLVDYYRYVIEHPEWMATQTHNSPDLYKGDDRGRIYRITPSTPLPAPGKIQLGKASSEELVKQLASPNIWWRRTAQRLLVDRHDTAAVASLIKLFEARPSAEARLHAMWTLDALAQLDGKLIEKALADPEPGVRENAILLAEPRLSREPQLVEKVLQLERDPDPRVRFQLLCTLGGISSAASRAAQDRLLTANIDDPWMQIAALTASSERAPQLFQNGAAFTNQKSEARADFFRQVSTVIATRRKPAEIRAVLNTLLRSPKPDSAWWREATLDGLAQGLRGPDKSAGMGQDLLLQLFETSDGEVRRAALRALGAAGLPPNSAAAIARAVAAAESGTNNPDARADALGLVALADASAHEALFKQLVDPRQPEPVQAAAVRGLGRVKGAEVGTFLLERWKAMTPPVRMDAADAMYLDPARPKLMLEAIRSGVVQPWTLAFRHKRQLLMSRDAALRESARALLEEKAGDREKVLKRYEAALDKTGDAHKGREVFERVCAKCHKLNGLGHEVGPDLATIRNRSPQLILPDIIMPSKSIAQNYESYVVETRSRGIVEGVLGPQTPTTITIRHEEGKEDVIRRDDIKEMRITNLSAMPEDLDKQVSVDQMADLLKFLKTPQ